MCLIAFAFDSHPRFRLVVAANRDEYYRRPTRPAGWWRTDGSEGGAAGIFAGRDLLAGGTWLGVSRAGRFAALTNYRDGQAAIGGPSRGALPAAFLSADTPAGVYLDELAADAGRYGGFNLIAATLGPEPEMAWLANRGHGTMHRLAPGLYGLSNHLLETPWPKTTRLKQRLADALDAGDPRELEDRLLAALSDPAIADDHLLPDTGIGLANERMLSPAFIRGADYGTRCSTVIAIDRHGWADIVERTWPRPDDAPDVLRERRTRFLTTPAAS